mmetsp:Transcript_80367/g.141834  ORF Transcript_80367/g.141834 Transcript_80367/m.141834 type:complete len:256 (-) Transcript_80367:196-963(-)
MKYGWYPVFASMILSNLSGPISQASIARFKTFALFQVVMNGAGGNLGAIFASKLSTDLVMAKAELVGRTPTSDPSKQPMLPVPFRRISKNLNQLGQIRADLEPNQDLVDKSYHLEIRTDWVDMREQQSYARTWMTVQALTQSGDMGRFARMLIMLIIPGQALFSCVVVGRATSWSALPSFNFVLCLIVASLLQVCILMMAARTLVVVLWRNRIDPDNGASPLVCGLGDLFGTSLLTLAYLALAELGDEVWPGEGL